MKTAIDHIASGTYRKDRHHRVNGEALEGIPDPPDHLSEDEQQIYLEVCQRLHETNALTAGDLFIVEMFAVQLCLHRKAKRELETAGVLISMHTNKNGSTNPVQSPWVNLILKSSDQLLKLSAKLGLNVVDRSKQTRSEPKQNGNSLIKFGGIR